VVADEHDEQRRLVVKIVEADDSPSTLTSLKSGAGVPDFLHRAGGFDHDFAPQEEVAADQRW